MSERGDRVLSVTGRGASRSLLAYTADDGVFRHYDSANHANLRNARRTTRIMSQVICNVTSTRQRHAESWLVVATVYCCARSLSPSLPLTRALCCCPPACPCACLRACVGECVPAGSPSHRNSYDCGVYVLAMSEYLATRYLEWLEAGKHGAPLGDIDEVASGISPDSISGLRRKIRATIESLRAARARGEEIE